MSVPEWGKIAGPLTHPHNVVVARALKVEEAQRGTTPVDAVPALRVAGDRDMLRDDRFTRFQQGGD